MLSHRIQEPPFPAPQIVARGWAAWEECHRSIHPPAGSHASPSLQLPGVPATPAPRRETPSRCGPCPQPQRPCRPRAKEPRGARGCADHCVSIYMHRQSRGRGGKVEIWKEQNCWEWGRGGVLGKSWNFPLSPFPAASDLSTRELNGIRSLAQAAFDSQLGGERSTA